MSVKKGRWAADKGWRWRGEWDGWGVSLSLSLRLVYPAGGPRDPDKSPDVTYCTLPTPLLPVPAGVMSQASWGCHVHTPSPSPASVPSLNSASITGVPLWPGTVNGARTKHRPKCNHASLLSLKHKSFKLCNKGKAIKC